MRARHFLSIMLLAVGGGCSDGGVDAIDPDAFEGEPGTRPGLECRPDDHPDGPCDQDLSGLASVDMVCVNGLCLVDCAVGGDFLCRDIVSFTLACSATAGNVCVPGCVDDGVCGDGLSCFERENTCLPTGGFPSSPCREGDALAADGPCDQDVAGVAEADMVCVQDTCVIDCAAGGTALCQQVNPALTCTGAGGDVCVVACEADGDCDPGFSCFTQEGSCLPTGAFPTSPCRGTLPECDSGIGGVDGADMICVEGQCVVDCADGGDTLCGAVDASLGCSATAGDICLPVCGADGACPDGFSCFSREDRCLPTGAFPTSPCRAEAPQCDTGLGGVEGADMVCTQGQCLLDCSVGGEALCQAVDASLTCSTTAGGLCLPVCTDHTDCDEGLSCFATEGACLPTGAFPSSPCREGPSPCDHDLAGNPDADMQCVMGQCIVGCGEVDPCAAVDPRLACSSVAGGCVLSCGEQGACDDGFSCFANEDVCLPTGAFPGSPCSDGACAQDLFGVDEVDMVCSADTCVVDCQEGGDFLCGIVDPSLACSAAAGGACVPACVEGACPAGFDCFTSEGTCLPTGAFPGGPCVYVGAAPGVCGAVGGAQMLCVEPDPSVGELCLIDCGTIGQAGCQAIDPSLSCFAQPGSAALCLPNGTFPGSLCRADDDPEGPCDQGLQGNDDVGMACVAGTCQVNCTVGGDAFCALYSSAASLPVTFGCAEGHASAFCAQPCGSSTDCGGGGSCDLDQGLCLPYTAVTLIHTGDLHAHFDGVGPSSAYTPESTRDDVTVGGFARLGTLIERAQTDAENRGDVVLTVDSGDFTMGTAYEALGGVVEFGFFSIMDYDAVALGEHELDWTPDGLALMLGENIKGSPVVPVLSANLMFDVGSTDDALEGLWDPDDAAAASVKPLKRYVVLDKGDVKVGIFGLMGRGASKLAFAAEPLTFDDPIATARDMVRLLREDAAADIVIALSHGGSTPPPGRGEDEIIAAAVDGIDVIVTGHGHGPGGTSRVGDTLIIRSAPFGRELGELRVALTSAGVDLDERRHILHIADDSVPGKAGLIAAGSGYVAAINGLLAAAGVSWALDSELANIDRDITLAAGRESGLGNLVADAYRGVSTQLVAATSDPTPLRAVFVVNGELGGGLRARVAADGTATETTVQFADVFAAAPYGIGPDQLPGYPLMQAYVNGADLKQILEVGASVYYLSGETFWLNVAGVRFDYNVTRAPFDRVTGVWLEDPDGSCTASEDLLEDPDFTSTSPAHLYRVGASLFAAGGIQRLATLTTGALAPTLRGRTGTPITDLTTRIIDADPAKGGVQELKGWAALASYLQILDGSALDIGVAYGGPAGRVAICADPVQANCPTACPAPAQ